MNRPRSASVTFVLMTLVFSTLGGGLVIPVLPGLMRGFLGGDLGAASRYYGAFVALHAAMQFVFAPILGALSDRFGRRAVLLSSLFGAALNYVVLALAPSLGWLFVGRVIVGISGANISTAMAYIADVTPPEERSVRFGLVGAACGLGIVLGPALGGALGGIHARLPFLVAAALELLTLLYGFFFLPESPPPEQRRRFSLRRSNPLSSLRGLARSGVLIGLSGATLCDLMAQQVIQSVWVLYTQERFGWGTLDVGVSLAVVGATSVIAQGGLIRVIMPRLGAFRTALTGIAVNLVSFVAAGLVTRGWMIYAIMIPSALGGLAGPALRGLISREVTSSEQGEIQGSLASLASLTAIAGPLLGTWLLARFGPEAATPRIPGAAFFAAAGFSLAGLVLALRLSPKPP